MTATYHLTSTAGLDVDVAERADAVQVLTGHLLEQLPAGPVGWTITSPWDLVYEGRLNLNGLTHEADDAIATQMDYIANSLDEEAAGPPTTNP
jgi:hypothetical protein